MSISSSGKTGAVDVGTSAVQLTADETLKANVGIQLAPDSANTGVIYVGFTDSVTAGTDNDTDGYPLGTSLLVPFRRPQDVYLVSDSADQKVRYMIV